MIKTVLPAVLLIAIAPCTSIGQESPATDKDIRVRVYRDWVTDGKSYEIVLVPVSEGSILEHGSVKSACLEMTKYTGDLNVSCGAIREQFMAAKSAIEQTAATAGDLVAPADRILEYATVLREATARPNQRPRVPHYMQQFVSQAHRIQTLPGRIKLCAQELAACSSTDAPNSPGLLETLDSLRMPDFGLRKADTQVETFIRETPDVIESARSYLKSVGRNTKATDEALDNLKKTVERIAPGLREIGHASKAANSELQLIAAAIDTLGKRVNDILKSTMLVITPQDQNSSEIIEVVEDQIFAAPYRWGYKFHLANDSPFRKPPRTPSKACLFTDASKEGIPNAKVEMWLSQSRYPTMRGDRRVFIGEDRLDEDGMLQCPALVSSLGFAFKVHHPDCGPIAAAHQYDYQKLEYERYYVSAMPKDMWTIFTDALGDPMPEAKVSVYRGQLWQGWSQTGLIAESTLDSAGRLKPPSIDPKLGNCFFIVSHPDYGLALAEPRCGRTGYEPMKTCTVPLVKIGTEAQVRSIWGTAVDCNDTPISGAMVECNRIYTPGGGTLHGGSYYPCRTMTDEEGFFCLYQPIEQKDPNERTLIPAASKYLITVQPPGDSDLQRLTTHVKSGEQSKVIFEPVAPPAETERGYFYRFVFTDQSGPITDPEKLENIRVSVRTAERLDNLKYDQWKDGGSFPLGTYSAYMPQYAPWRFKPIEVTANGPEELIFEPIEPEVFYGRILDGVTGKPLPNVVVGTGCVPFANSSSITAEQWEQLYAVAANPEGPQVDTGQRKLISGDITLSDEDGGYYVTYIDGMRSCRVDKIVALKPGYIGSLENFRLPAPENFFPTPGKNPLLPRSDTPREITIKMFPGATVIVEPQLPSPERSYNIGFSWKVDPSDTRPWLADLADCRRRGRLFIQERLGPNTALKVPVPAGVKLTIEIDERNTKRWQPAVFRDVRLEQGQTLDLGKINFEPSPVVRVKVVDSSGRPVEGVAVGLCVGSSSSPRHKSITDTHGITSFHVPPNSTGRFEVRHQPMRTFEPGRRIDPPALIESVEYNIGGPEDKDREFTLQLSDKMLDLLFD